MPQRNVVYNIDMIKNRRQVQDFQQKILIVDDQYFNIDAATIVLKYAVKLMRTDQIIDSAQDGLQAFEKVKQNVILN